MTSSVLRIAEMFDHFRDKESFARSFLMHKSCGQMAVDLLSFNMFQVSPSRTVAMLSNFQVFCSNLAKLHHSLPHLPKLSTRHVSFEEARDFNGELQFMLLAMFAMFELSCFKSALQFMLFPF